MTWEGQEGTHSGVLTVNIFQVFAHVCWKSNCKKVMALYCRLYYLPGLKKFWDGKTSPAGTIHAPAPAGIYVIANKLPRGNYHVRLKPSDCFSVTTFVRRPLDIHPAPTLHHSLSPTTQAVGWIARSPSFGVLRWLLRLQYRATPLPLPTSAPAAIILRPSGQAHELGPSRCQWLRHFCSAVYPTSLDLHGRCRFIAAR